MLKKVLSIMLIIIVLVSMATCSMASSTISSITNTEIGEVSSVRNMGMGVGMVLVVLVISLAIYLIPTIVACVIKHPYKLGIILVDIFLGWSLIGWLGSLIWACILPNSNENKSNGNKYEGLESLQRLKDSGAITDVEYEIEKAKLLK